MGGLRGAGSSGTLAGLCTAPEHVALLGWAQHPWPERGPWVSSTGSRYCTEQNEVHRWGGGNRAEWSSDYGSSTLWELWACSRTVSREGEGSWAPERTLSVLLLNAARLSHRNGGVTTPAHLQGEPWGCPASHPRGARAVPLPVLPRGWLRTERSARPGAAGPQPEVPASSARSPCLQHSPSPRTSAASPGRSPQWSVR